MFVMFARAAAQLTAAAAAATLSVACALTADLDPAPARAQVKVTEAAPAALPVGGALRRVAAAALCRHLPGAGGHSGSIGAS